ncbi:hypothetical protein OU426_08665 [Frigidibacter sp. RF13]|uniref:hypothetical protein n=1 Tax=Frigidibacter sp. RF13 TaxID=2997340 RepID=UPI00226E4538|nr:hypothetical protein [Frigidibacter sp. RF13]MCY1126924.1 hypothetical protein [Frigidibacter sp. RF13]
MNTPFETQSLRMVEAHLFEVQAPEADVGRILEAVTAIDPLAMSPAYDSNAFVSAPGTERYRPREGAVAGVEEAVRQRPGVVSVSFETVQGAEVAGRIAEAIFQVHCYQEPVIRITTLLTARSKGLDQSANPHRWWNTTGDWKRQP